MKAILVVIGAVVASAVVFGILQPVLWQPIYGEKPPNQVIDLSLMLTIFLALLAVGVAIFGIGAWRILREEMKNEMLEAVRRSDVRITRAMASVITNTGYGKFSDYQIFGKTEHLDEAILITEEAWTIYGRLLDDTLPENEGLVCGIKNNRGAFLAIRGNAEDAQVAKDCGAFLVERMGNFDNRIASAWRDTVATIKKAYPET